MVPASDSEAERMNRFKTGSLYEVDIKITHNSVFHSKLFVFFGFCFQHWRSDLVFADETTQKEAFRKRLTVLAGYHDPVFNLDGTMALVAQSLSFAKMEEEKKERCYNALVNAAMEHIFTDISDDGETFDKLMGFF